MRVLNSTVALFFQILTIAFCVLILSSCGSGNTTSPANGSPTNNPPASVAFATKVFQTADKSDSIRFISSTEIEFTEHKTNVVGAYTRQDNKIRAVFDGLGTKRALYFVETEDGLTAEDDGKKYLSETAFRKLEEELKKRLETHAALKAYRTALDKKDYDTAWSELQKYGTDNKYITDKIDLLFTKRDSLAANALAKDTFEKYKDDGVTLYLTAFSLWNNTQYPEVQPDLDLAEKIVLRANVLSQGKDAVYCLKLLALLNFRKGNLDKAIEFITSAIEKQPNKSMNDELQRKLNEYTTAKAELYKAMIKRTKEKQNSLKTLQEEEPKQNTEAK